MKKQDWLDLASVFRAGAENFRESPWTDSGAFRNAQAFYAMQRRCEEIAKGKEE
jgi:hypothetical protein